MHGTVPGTSWGVKSMKSAQKGQIGSLGDMPPWFGREGQGAFDWQGVERTVAWALLQKEPPGPRSALPVFVCTAPMSCPQSRLSGASRVEGVAVLSWVYALVI